MKVRRLYIYTIETIYLKAEKYSTISDFQQTDNPYEKFVYS